MKTDLELLAAQLDYTAADFDQKYSNVLCLLNTELDHRQLKNELVAYATSIQKDFGVIDYPNNLVGLEGKIAYCLNRGAKLKPSSSIRVLKFLEKLESEAQLATPSWTSLPQTASSRQIAQYVACYSQLDNLKTRVLKNHLSARELAGETRAVVQRYAPNNQIVHRQLVEHYQTLFRECQNDPAVDAWLAPLRTIVETLNLLTSARRSRGQAQKASKARKFASTAAARDRKGEEAASKVRVKDEDTALGLQSIDPTNLVGAEAVVVYNTKTRHVEVYRCSGTNKLSMKGARITNFDPSLSQGRVLRDPTSWLPRWTSATTIRRLEVLIAEIKGKSWTLTGKLNSNHLIIKVL